MPNNLKEYTVTNSCIRPEHLENTKEEIFKLITILKAVCNLNPLQAINQSTISQVCLR